MATHGFYPERGNSESGIVRLSFKVGIGATGAVLTTASATDTAPALSSVARNTTGDYTLTTAMPFVAGTFRGLRLTHNINSVTPTDITFQVYAVDEAAKTVKFKCLTGVTAVELGSGCTLYGELAYKYGGG